MTPPSLSCTDSSCSPITPTFPVPRIVFVAEAYFTDMHAGVASYVRDRNWTLDATMVCHPGSMPRPDGCDGILASVHRPAVRDWVIERSCPVVHLLHSHLEFPDWPMVVCDWEAVGRLGAQHFLELGDVHFAFYSFIDYPDCTECMKGFARECEAHGRKVHVFDYNTNIEREMRRLTSRAERVDWCKNQLASLPRPLAVMAATDNFAVDLVLAARALGWDIPRDIAILGTEDLPLIRGTVPEEISSVDVNYREVGRRAAELMDRLMQGDEPGSSDVPMLVKIPPVGVNVRESTCTFVCDHPGVTAAALFVRNHFHESISVASVAAKAGMSLRSLQVEYRARLGRTVKEDIVHERLKRAQFLLERTDLKLSAVASESGFGNPEHLCHVFQRTHHATPQAWRQKHRGT